MTRENAVNAQQLALVRAGVKFEKRGWSSDSRSKARTSPRSPPEIRPQVLTISPGTLAWDE